MPARFARAKPPVEVENLEQTPNASHEHLIVSFEHERERHSFTTDYASGYMDRDSVLHFFEQFMLKAGRAERVFDLQLDVDYGFIVAGAEAGSRLATQLYIPLRDCPSDL